MSFGVTLAFELGSEDSYARGSWASLVRSTSCRDGAIGPVPVGQKCESKFRRNRLKSLFYSS